MTRYRFAIKEQFQAKGYQTAYAVARALNKKDNQAARIIDPGRTRINMLLINELCEFLGCAPGDLFVRVDDKSSGKAKARTKSNPLSR
jgi:hypothetical protein